MFTTTTLLRHHQIQLVRNEWSLGAVFPWCLVSKRESWVRATETSSFLCTQVYLSKSYCEQFSFFTSLWTWLLSDFSSKHGREVVSLTLYWVLIIEAYNIKFHQSVLCPINKGWLHLSFLFCLPRTLSPNIISQNMCFKSVSLGMEGRAWLETRLFSLQWAWVLTYTHRPTHTRVHTHMLMRSVDHLLNWIM